MDGVVIVKRILRTPIFVLIIFLTACNPNENEKATEESNITSEKDSIDVKQLEENFISSTENMYEDIQQTMIKLNLALDDSNYVEVNINSISLLSSESDNVLTKQRNADTELLLNDPDDLYKKYKPTVEYANEIRSLMLSIQLDLANAAEEFDEKIITEVRGKVFKINRLTKEAIEQLPIDSYSSK